MKNTIKLSLVAFILVSGSSYAFADTIPSTAINSLAYDKVTFSNKKQILSTTYNKPTDITFDSNNTNNHIILGNHNQDHTIKDININLTNNNGWIWAQGNLTLNNLNISKNNNGVHGFIVDNNANIKMLGGSLKNIAINIGSKSYNGSLSLDKVSLENIKYGYNTDKDIGLVISNSTIKDSDFKHNTTIDNSVLSSTIKGNITLVNKVDLSKATIDTTDLKLNNIEVKGLGNDKSELKASGWITNSGNVSLDNIAINNTNIKINHHIILGNSGNDHDVNLIINNSDLTNTAINRYSKNVNNAVLTINDSRLNNTNLANDNAGLGNVFINDSIINNTDSNVSINKGDNKGTFYFKNSEVNSVINGGILNFDNSQVKGNISGELNFTNKSKIDATISSGNITLDNSEISGSITASNLTATNGSIIGANSTISGKTDISDSTIKADISSKNLNITNSTASGTADKKLDIKSTGNHMQLNGVTFSDVALSSGNNRIDLNGDNTFNRILVENTSPKGTGHHITLGNNASATFNDSEFINTAINNYSWTYNNTTTFNKSKFTNTSIGSASAASTSKVYINDSEINNTDTNATIGGGTIYLTNSTINSDFTGGHIYFDTKSKVTGTLKGSSFHLNNITKSAINDNIKLESGNIIAYESLELDGKKDFIKENTDLNFLIENNSELRLNNLNISNTEINSWKYNKDELTNNKLYISNSTLNEVGIGSKVNGAIKYLTDYLSLDNVDINNTQANKTMYAKVIDIKGGNITIPMITTLHQIYAKNTDGRDFFNVNKTDTFINVDNAVINSNIETGELHLKNNSVLNGNIQGTHKVYIDNSTLNGNITKDNRNTCYEQEGCTGEIEDVIITNSTIKGDINEVGNVSLTNTNLEASNVIVKNDISIDNSTSTEAKTITGNFQVG
ncbi:hypothetical protein AVBRAN12642_06335, partial [Campylobacter sp. RM12642]|uniref:beta strand repeat-containing protein n=1 Tax=Campylobacter sp. RM12642 TaxID=2735736 RepID=UPI003015230F|nr:hypothetical protein [Campylobacter sp. RM12642]